MNLFNRIKNILIALAMIAGAVAIIRFKEYGYVFVVLLLSLSLILYGLKNIFFYFTLAKHMVGGKNILYVGVIVLDFGIFTLTMTDNPTIYIILYLLVIHVFTGIVSIMNSLEAKSMSDSHWKLNFSYGVINVLVGIGALIFGAILKSDTALIYIYCSGLIYSAIIRIISAFRKTAIVYIQ